MIVSWCAILLADEIVLGIVTALLRLVLIFAVFILIVTCFKLKKW